MPDQVYRIIYEGVPDKANRGIDSLIAKLAAGERAVASFNAELKKTAAASAAAEAALKDVGKGNNSVTAFTRRLKDLEAELQKVAASGGAAAAATAGVGAGGAAGGAGAGPHAGGGGGGGIVAFSGRTLLRAGLVGATFSAFRRGAGAAGGAAADQREYFAGANKVTEDFRADLAQYASLRGEAGPNDKILREATRFGRDTGIRPEGIVPFLTEYEGSAATGREAGNIGGVVGKDGFTREKQLELERQLKVVGGQFAVRTGLDPQTAGDLTGIASVYKRFNSAKDLAGELGGMHYGLDQGRGDITPLARGELGQAGSAIKSGRVSGLPELGAFIGVASVISKSAGSAGTSYAQITRLLNETGGDKGDFLRIAGVADKKGDFAKLKALRDHIRVAQSQGAAKDVNTYLQQNGFGNSTDRKSVIGMLENVDVLERRIAEANRIAANGDEVLARNAANQGQPDATAGRIEATDFGNTVETGIMMAPLARGRAEATAHLKDPNQPGGQRLKAGKLGGIADAVKSGMSLGSRTGEQIRVDAAAVNDLFAEGRRYGLNLQDKYSHLDTGRYPWDLGTDEQTFAQEYAAASRDVEAAKHAREAAAALNKLAGAMNRPKGPPAPPGNGGAGVNPARR